MNKFTHLSEFARYLFDDQRTIRKATPIIEGLLKARSPRLSDIARQIVGGESKNYKCIQRFLEQVSPQDALLRLFREEAQFAIGDPTEMPRPQANKTDYVGTLNDAQISGYWLFIDCIHSFSWQSAFLWLCRLLLENHQPGSHLP